MIRPFQGMHPRIDETAFVAETAVIIGDVEMGPESSIWYNCVARADVNSIKSAPAATSRISPCCT